MSAVSQIRMQAAASRLNGVSAQPGAKLGGPSAPAGFENFLTALDQSKLTRLNARSISSPGSSSSSASSVSGMQNLPHKSSRETETANNADPMQLLMSQLMAQSMLNQVVSSQNQNIALQPAGAMDPQSALRTQDLLTLNIVQGLDPKQTVLITQALSKALIASGQATDQNSQAQALALLQAFQNQALASQSNNLAINPNAAQNAIQNAIANQTPAQNAVQIAVAIQAAAQKNGINLPSEVQSQLNELINQGATGPIKLLEVEAQTGLAPGAISTQPGQVDPAKASSIQNLTDTKNQKIVDSTILDKTQKLKTLDGASSPGFGEKSAAAKAASAELSKLDNTPGDLSASVAKQNINPSLNPLPVGIANTEPGAAGLQKIEVKAADVSLSSGPLHAEILNSAKTGGGRIMFELTPPEQGTIRIDLRINPNGQAHLIVEGASDATKSRLDQGGQNLKNEFAQMGLNLSLDLRQQGGQSQQMHDRASFGGKQGGYANFSSTTQGSSPINAVGSIRSGDNMGSGDTVHLYA